MFVSSTLLKNAVAQCRKSSENKRENFNNTSGASAGASAAFTSFAFVIAIIFFALEIVLLFYAINMAIVCTEAGPERVVNIVLAVTFTIPYVMLNILFNKCAKKSLKGGWFPKK